MDCKIVIDSWEPDYATSFQEAGELSNVEVNTTIEIDDDWAGIGGDSPSVPYDEILFVDGVQRTEASLWLQTPDTTFAGRAASFGAGVVRVNGKAGIEEVRIGHCLASPFASGDLQTRSGMFKAVMAGSDQPADLHAAVQTAMGDLEKVVVGNIRHKDSLVVIDGPLSGHSRIKGAVGYIKTHHARYLEGQAYQSVSALQPGERSPVFAINDKWKRFSWYLRLPCELTHPWAGIVRLECADSFGFDLVQTLANATCSLLPRFASEPHKDARAPQNLYPIAGLERLLRHRLGDPVLIRRSLQIATRQA